MDDKKKYEAGKARIHMRKNFENELQFARIYNSYNKNPEIPVLSLLIWNGIYFGVIVFVFNVWLGERMDPSRIFLMNLILFGLYFLTTFFFCHIVVKFNAEKQRLDHEKKQAESLKEYTSQIETMYGEFRRFRHDYVNILTSMSGYLVAGCGWSVQKFVQRQRISVGGWCGIEAQ